MALTSTTVPVPHGVVFIYDPTMVIDVPSDTGAAPVLATPTCVSVWTFHDVDGQTTLMLADDYKVGDCKLVFRGFIETEGRRIAIHNSSCEPLIEMELSSVRAEVAIYVNDAANPTKLVCTAR